MHVHQPATVEIAGHLWGEEKMNYALLTLILGVIGTGSTVFKNVTAGMNNLSVRQSINGTSSLQPGPNPSTYQPAQQSKTRSRFVKYPRLAIISFAGLVVLYPLYFDLVNGSSDTIVALGVIACSVVVISCTIYAVVKAIQLRRWGWLAAIVVGFVLIGGFIAVIFSLAGPTQQRTRTKVSVIPSGGSLEAS
jgi:hypothetical protein